MPSLVEFLVVVPLHLSVGFRWNYGSFSGILQGHQHPLIGVETFVCKHDVRFELWQQHIGSIQIASLTASEMKANRVAQSVDRGMNLGAQPTFATSDGLVGAPFFSAPALC